LFHIPLATGKIGKMKMTITAAAALIGLAVTFGPAGAAPATSLPDGTPVIEVGGRDFGGHRSGQRRGGRDFGHRGGGRDFGRRGGGRNFGRHGGGRNFGRHGGGRNFGHRGYSRGYGYGHSRHGHRHGHGHGHNYYGPFIYGGIALGTYLFLDTLDRY
jgi:hypothetical protein